MKPDIPVTTTCIGAHVTRCRIVAAVHLGRILFSVVSHRQAELVQPLIHQLEALRQPGLEVVLTLNVPESWQVDFQLPLKVRQNARAQGFGANHNAAFRSADSEFFCVANPDLRLQANPFPPLLQCLEDHNIGVVAPRVLGPDGKPEDNARHFPTPARLARKLLRSSNAGVALDYPDSGERIEPDWVAGMFMLFRSESFARIEGFDERYFLYYEDVDLCARLRLAGLRVMLEPRAHVVHLARRQSRRSARYAWWHARSMARWLCSKPCRLLRSA
jgi:hypothetical protein